MLYSTDGTEKNNKEVGAEVRKRDGWSDDRVG